MAEWTAANPGCRITKKWVHEKIREVASYQYSVNAWVIRPEALMAAGAVEGAV